MVVADLSQKGIQKKKDFLVLANVHQREETNLTYPRKKLEKNCFTSLQQHTPKKKYSSYGFQLYTSIDHLYDCNYLLQAEQKETTSTVINRTVCKNKFYQISFIQFIH